MLRAKKEKPALALVYKHTKTPASDLAIQIAEIVWFAN